MLKNDHNITSTSMSNRSPILTNANKYKSSQEVTLKDSIHALSQEMKNHFKNSQKQTFNDAFHDIIKNIHKEEKNQLKQAQHSILDLDIVSGKSTQNFKNKKHHSHRGHSAKNKEHKSDLYHKGHKGNRLNSNTSFESKDDSKNQKQNFYEREMARLHKKHYDIEAMRNHIRAEEKENLKDKPTLSQKTRKLIEENMNNVCPIYMRTQAVIEKKNSDLENLKIRYTEMDRVETTRFNKTVSNQINTTEFMDTVKKIDQDKVNEFVSAQMNWLKKRDEEKERKKNEIEKKKVDSEVGLFKPNINKISETIVQATRSYKVELENNNNNNSNMSQNVNLPTHERLFNQHEGNLEKRKMMYIENLPLFVPLINKNILNHIKSKVYSQTGDIKSFSKGNRNASANASSRGVNNINSNLSNNDSKINKDSKSNNINTNYLEENMTLNLESTPLNERKNVPRQSVSNRMYSKKSSWEVQVEGVNKMNKRRSTSKRKSDSVSINDLYKLNIGVGSSWDKQKENLIPLNPKFKSIIGNILG